ncbi:lymphocyte antigen 86 isoform X1 [Trachypithecus francoisi]|uniref:lymphocyte antigen 86 isoform X1 n=1 Tax=Trachypithecus francoisi TaxID=54180 RepID=UPI00141BF463|nr:lymphocyte antigen 86 isoform X1 [Trachypithecus francoisi]XP_033072010.1 lymphocyte antigen 86 isoform X1 [Trachypithecus francoisi]
MVACALSFPSLQPHLGCSEEPREALTMKGFTAALFLGTLIFPSCSGGSGGRAWPTHTVCSDSGLEVLYQSCDPLQDFGFSIEKCSKQLKSNINIRFGIILREDIKELFLDLALMSQGSSVLNFSYPICEVALPKFSFCGRRKGVVLWHTKFCEPLLEAVRIQGSSPELLSTAAGSMLPKPILFWKHFLSPDSSDCSAAAGEQGPSPSPVVLNLEQASASPGAQLQPQLLDLAPGFPVPHIRADLLCWACQ